jgi:hypothetical protein
MVWFAFRSGYASCSANKCPRVWVKAFSLLASCCIAAGSPGLAFAPASPLTAALRACTTASSVPRSCAR